MTPRPDAPRWGKYPPRYTDPRPVPDKGLDLDDVATLLGFDRHTADTMRREWQDRPRTP